MASPIVTLAYDNSPYFMVPNVARLPNDVQNEISVKPGNTVWIEIEGIRRKYRVLPENPEDTDYIFISTPDYNQEELSDIQKYGSKQITGATCKYEPKLDLRRHYKRSWEDKVFALHPEFKKELGWKYGYTYPFKTIGDCTLKAKTWIDELGDDIKYVFDKKGVYFFPPFFEHIKKSKKRDEANSFRKLPVE